MTRPSRISSIAWVVLPLLGTALGVLVVTFLGHQAGQASDVRPAPGVSGATVQAADSTPPPDAGTAREPREPAALMNDDYECLQPPLEILREPACDEEAPYPRCRWQLPDTASAEGLYEVWRNTIPEHRWGRPGLVSLVLAAAREYQARWPGERVVIGDLDAPGPRHQTHDRGVDVDLYLEDAMIARNLGGRRYPDNYEGRPSEEVRLLRARVLDFAKILATCSRGRLRIYYNDPEIVRDLRAWFDARGLESDVGPPMQMHNPLHRFHFHMTIAEDLAPLPVARSL